MGSALVPPPKSRGTAALAVAGRALDDFEAEVGGRGKLIDALLYAPDLPADLAYVVGLVADPRNDARKLSTVCAAGDISIGELVEAFKRGLLAKAMVGAIQLVAERTPAIVEDVLTRSVPHEVDCPTCKGTDRIRRTDLDGRITEEACGACVAGKVIVEPDFARQKFALTELAGLGSKGSGGPLVQIDQRDQRQQSLTLPSGVTPAAYAQLMGGVDQLLYGTPKAVEAEVVDSPPAPAYPSAEPGTEHEGMGSESQS